VAIQKVMIKYISAAFLFCLSQLCFAGQIVHVGTASSDVIVVVIETVDGEAVPSQDSALWPVNDSEPSQVGRYSYVWYEEKAQGARYPLSQRHHMYLQLSSELTEDAIYIIETPYGPDTLEFNSRASLCESIKVNQTGYFEFGTVRYANLGIFLGDLGPQELISLPTYDVVDASSDEIVLSGDVTYWGDDTDPSPSAIQERGSGEYVYRMDLSGLTDGGPYYISIPGFGRSYEFGVGETSTKEIAYVHTRGLYHQRCGIALEAPFTSFTRGTCHTSVEITEADPDGFITDRGDVMEIHGGYHDAGDFDRRFGHTLIPAWMLNLYEAFPDHFADKQYLLPESGNGIPDWLDETLWSILVWEYLQDESGGIRGGTEANRHPEYGVVNAETDHLIYRTYRIYGHTTAVGAGLFAHASRLVRSFDSQRADSLQDRAVRAWEYLESHDLATAHDAQKMYASLQLYLATGAAEYHDAFKTHAGYLLGNPGWPEQYNPVWWNLNTIKDGMIFTPYFFGYLITDREVDPGIQTELSQLIQDAAQTQLNVVMNQPYPIGDTPGLAWGTATNQGRYAEPMILMYRLTGDQEYLDGVSLLADYSLGLNPLGKCYVTGLGDNPPNCPLQLDSYFTYQAGKGNVPGIVVYGPVADPNDVNWERAVWEKIYPEIDTLPEQRRYSDGWSFIGANEFTTWETMALNVCMYGFLSSFYEPDTVHSTVKKKEHLDAPASIKLLQNYPNPFNPVTTIRYFLPENSTVRLDIYNIKGQKIKTLVNKKQSAGTYTVRWDALNESGIQVANGVYLCKIKATNHSMTFSEVKRLLFAK